MENLNDLELLVQDMNQNMEDIENSQDFEFNKNDLPLSLNVMLNGIGSTNAINFLFSDEVDRLLDSLIKMIETGNFTKFLDSEEKIKKLFNRFGFGSGQFSGELSNRLINSIDKTISSKKFQRSKTFTLKLLRILSNLKREARKIKDPEAQKKFNDMVYSITQVVKIINNIWKNRKLINDRVRKGLLNIVTEDHELETEKIIKII